MTAPVPFAVRSSAGIDLVEGPPSFAPVAALPQIPTKFCRTLTFSPDGQFFAYSDGLTLCIIQPDTWSTIATIQGTKAYHLSFSPKSTFLATWEQFTTNKDNPEGKPNLNIYRSATGDLVKSFLHKKQPNWEPRWSADEQLLSRQINADVVFYEHHNFERIAARLSCAKVAAYSLSPLAGPYFALCHVPGASGQPALAKLFKYPAFEAPQAVATKSFFQCDKVDFLWNAKGSSALLLTSTEVDKTGGSYYGKHSLHFVGVNGQAAMVALSKEGPIYSVAWSPKSHEFCVIYGFIPAKATLFNLKCEPVFEFGASARNTVQYNPHGNLVLLGGFGNLRGSVEVWDAAARKLVGSCEAPDSTQLEWSPDGAHFLTATTTPRLRISNGYKVWHYSGALLHERMVAAPGEVYEVAWRRGACAEPVVGAVKVEGIASSQPVASKQAYRPPSARNRPSVNFSLDDDDDEKAGSNKVGKNKKKREAKKARKVEEGEESAPGRVSTLKVEMSGDPEKDKKLKSLKKKLDAIEKLKEQQGQGKTLEVNQLAKIKAEGDLRKELELLKL